MTLKSKTTKLISSLLIFSILLPSVLLSIPKKTIAAAGTTAAIAVPTSDIPQETAGWLSQALHAVGVPSTVANTGLHFKDLAYFILQQTLKVVAKAVLAKMTQATINWINSDFHGAPLFLENPESFLRDIAKSEVRRIVDMIGYDTFRFPFGPQTARNVIASYKLQLEQNAQYTLSKVINDPDLLVRYRNDFNYGGWNGFLINTQYPQNNYLGFEGIIQQNLASRLEGTLQAPAQKIQSLLQQGMGFLSPQTCPTNPSYNNGVNEFLKPSFKPTAYVPYNADGELLSKLGEPGVNEELEKRSKAVDEKHKAQVATEKAQWAKTNTCPGGLVNTTPGSVAANAIAQATGAPFLTTALDGALGNSVAAVFDALIYHFLDKGLNALSDATNSLPSLDDWTYDGESLGGGSSYTRNSDGNTLDIPNNVSLTVGQNTSTPLVGSGTAPYVIKAYPNSQIATAKINVAQSSGARLEVAGVSPGLTTVVVQDSSNPVEEVEVRITINAKGALISNPPEILADVNKPFTATISGGKGPYFMQTASDDTIATSVFADTSLVIIGIAPGETEVKIKDSSSTPKILTIPVTIPGDLELTIPQNISVGIGHVTRIPISGGNAPYSIVATINPEVANAEISGNDILVTGTVAGQATVIVQDSSSPTPKTANVMISTNSAGSLNIADDVLVAKGGSISIPVSGGTAPYVIKATLSKKIATGRMIDNNLVISGVKIGDTSIIVQDSSNPPKINNIKITVVTPETLIVNPKDASINIGQTVQRVISGGTAPYFIDPDPSKQINTSVARAPQIPNGSNILTITGISKGDTTVTVGDASGKTTEVQITVN